VGVAAGGQEVLGPLGDRQVLGAERLPRLEVAGGDDDGGDARAGVAGAHRVAEGEGGEGGAAEGERQEAEGAEASGADPCGERHGGPQRGRAARAVTTVGPRRSKGAARAPPSTVQRATTASWRRPAATGSARAVTSRPAQPLSAPRRTWMRPRIAPA